MVGCRMGSSRQGQEKTLEVTVMFLNLVSLMNTYVRTH